MRPQVPSYILLNIVPLHLERQRDFSRFQIGFALREQMLRCVNRSAMLSRHCSPNALHLRLLRSYFRPQVPRATGYLAFLGYCYRKRAVSMTC